VPRPAIVGGQFGEKIVMAKVVKVIELLSESPKGWEEAAQNAISYRLNKKVTLELEGDRSGKK
jgi:Dodecin